MAFTDLFKSLFKRSADSGDSVTAEPGDAVEYKECTITPAPIAEGGQFRTAGYITAESDGQAQRSEFVRADNHSSRDQAIAHSITKAKQIIDERGKDLFKSERC